MVNNIYGGTVAKVEIYMGGGYGDNSSKVNIIKGDLITNVYGGTFNGTFWGGPRGQTVEGGVYNAFMGGTFGSTFVASGLQTITPEVHNVFKNGPDGTYAVLKGTSYLGVRGGSVAGTYTIGRLYNTFEGDVNFKGILYCADGTQGGVQVEDLVKNEFKSGIFEKEVYCTTAKKNNILSAEVENSFYDGVQMKGVLYCGGQSGGSGSITNSFYGGNFAKYVYGVTSETDKQTYDYKVKGDVTNNFYGGTFNSQLICGGMATCSGTLTNNFHGGVYKYFVYGNTNSGNNNQMDVINNIYGGEFQAWFCGGSNKSLGGSITNNVYGGHFTATHKEANHSEAGRICFMGGDYSATGTNEKVPLLTNNIYGGIFEERVYLGGRIATIDKIHSMIAGGIFNGDRISPSMYQLSASTKVTENILNIKPDESDQTLLFACRYTAKGVHSSTAYPSYGLENCVGSKHKDTVILHAAKKPIYITGETFLNVDEVKGAVTFIQTENWVDGSVYLSSTETEDISMVSFFNGAQGLSGSAEIKRQDVDLGSTSTDQGIECSVLVGTDNASSPAVLQIPALAAINFVLDNNLHVNFYADKATMEAYLENVGSFNYKIACGDQILASGNIASMSDAQVVGDYVKVQTDFSVAAFSYGELLTLDFAGEEEEFTVYELLELGMANSASNPALVDLLKAIYNYGVEAEILIAGKASVDTYYDSITYTGTYNGKPTASTLVSGYKFAGSSLSIGKEVALNFFLNAASTEGLTFAANSSNGTLDASRVVVIPFSGNSQYNVVVSLKLDVASMDDLFTLTVKDANGTELAKCTNSVANCCATYIAADNEFAPISRALLAYIEKAQAI